MNRHEQHDRSDPLQPMREATRLTRSGRVADATRLIRRTLAARGRAGAPPVDEPSGPARPVRVPSSVVDVQRRGSGQAASAPDHGATSSRAGAEMWSGSASTPAGSREYRLHVPTRRHVGGMPLIVMLHGCTQNAVDFAAGTRMNALGDQTGCLVAYPEQTQQANPSRCWNWFRAEDQQRAAGEPSIIAAVVRSIAERHRVDRRRVYVAGMSAGAAMAVVMAHTYPEMFAAIGVHSGLAYGVAADVSSAFRAMRHGAEPPPTPGPGVPTIVFHGDSDRTVDQRNAEHVLRQATAHVPHPLLTVHQRDDGGRRSTRYTYRDADGRSLAEGWSVQGLAHAWSGGDARGSHTDPVGPDASAEMVRFFLEH